MWDSRNVLDSLLWEAAVDDMGIYPRAVIKEGVETLRTEWQNGWNAAVMKITEKHGKLSAWVRALTEEQTTRLREMLDADADPVWLSVRDDEVRLLLHCGDTFAYACADSERFELADLPDIFRLWTAHGHYGTTAWIARKRNAEPVKEYRYDAGYLKAKADL